MTKVTVEWDGYNWAGIVEGGGTTQARRLDQIPGRVVEVVKLMTGTTIAAVDVDMDIHVPGESDEGIAATRALRGEVTRLQDDLQDRTRRTAKALRAQGLPLRDIGQIVGVSYQRVHQLLDR